MSVCGQTEEESASEEAGAPLREAYEAKSVSKVVRVLTVLAYLLSVSLAAILLSVYYVCVWKSPDLPLLNTTADVEASARRAAHDNASQMHSPSGLGGSNIAVNDSLSYTTTNNTNGLAVTSEMPASTETGPTGLPDTTLPTHYKNNNINETNSTLVVGVDNETSVT